MFRRLVASGDSTKQEYTPINQKQDIPVAKIPEYVDPKARFEPYLIDRNDMPTHHIKHCDLKIDLYVTTEEYITLQAQERFPAMEYYSSAYNSRIMGYIDNSPALTSHITQLVLALGLRLRNNSYYTPEGTLKILIYSPTLLSNTIKNKLNFELFDTLTLHGIYPHNWATCVGVHIPTLNGEYIKALSNIYDDRLWLCSKPPAN